MAILSLAFVVPDRSSDGASRRLKRATGQKDLDALVYPRSFLSGCFFD